MELNNIFYSIKDLNTIASTGAENCLSTENDYLISKKPTQPGEKLEKTQAKITALLVSRTLSQIKELITTTKNPVEKHNLIIQLSNDNLLARALTAINDLHLETALETQEQLLLEENIQYINATLLLQTYIDNQSYFFYATYSPEMLVDLARGLEGLKLSANPLVPKEIRQLMGPKTTAAGTANGSYFLHAPVDLQSNKHTSDIAFVVKPTVQENGMIGTPGAIYTPVRPGIDGGKGAIRERIAYSCQTALGLDFGIPPTEIISSDHFVLSEVHGIIVSAYTTIIARIENSPENLLGILDVLKEKCELSPTVLVAEVLNNLYETLPEGKIKTLINALNTIDKQAYPTLTLGKLIMFLRKTDQIDMSIDGPLIKSLLSLYNISNTATPHSISSAQIYEPQSKTYVHVDVDEISNKEIHKLIIDLILFNTDRHLNNILFKTNENEDQVVLIDHGSTLPIPSVESLKMARFEWLALDQFDNPLDSYYADKIAALNINDFITDVKRDIEAHTKQFGSLCEIEESCFQLMELNLRMLKIGIALGCSVKTMAIFHQDWDIEDKRCGGEVVKIFEKYIGSLGPNKSIDWNKVEDEIKIILQKPLLERENNQESV